VAKGRYVLRYRGEGSKPHLDLAGVSGLADAVVVDSSPRMLVVDAEDQPLRELVDTLPDWVMAPEHRYEVPDTRMKVERPPDPPLR
jgi:hypothetical protein